MKSLIKKYIKRSGYVFGIAVAAVVVGISLQFAKAWTEPGVAAPGGNVGAPINTGSVSQGRLGNLGIGIAIPGYSLHVVGTGLVSSAFWADRLFALGAGNQGAPAFSSNGDANTGMFFPALDTLGFSTGGSERVRIGTNGNVGIGMTTNPSAKLEVNGGAYIKGGSGDVNNSGTVDIADSTSINQMATGIVVPTAAQFATADIDGDGTVDGADAWWASRRTVNLYTDANMNSKSRIDDKSRYIYKSIDGNVGIGTTDPGYKLDVAGNANVANGLTVGNASGAYTYITLRDDESTNGIKYVHANGNVVGFLGGDGNWLSYWDSAGSQRLTGGQIYMANSGNNFYGDGANLAARMSGDFYVQNQDGSGFRDMRVNDVYLNSAGKWASSLDNHVQTPTGCFWENGGINPGKNSTPTCPSGYYVAGVKNWGDSYGAISEPYCCIF